MRHSKLIAIAGVVLVGGIGLALACTRVSAADRSQRGRTANRPSSSRSRARELNRMTLTERAAERLGIETAPVAEEQIERDARSKIIPYAAVIYDADGGTWAYTNPEPLIFVRDAIDVERIEGDTATLTDGPAAGTAVVTVGAAELFGTESIGTDRAVTPDASRGHRACSAKVCTGVQEVHADDALDRRIEPEVPLPRRRPGRGDDGLRRRAAARHAGRCLPRVRAADGRDPDRLPRALRRRGRGAGHRPAGAGAQRRRRGWT